MLICKSKDEALKAQKALSRAAQLLNARYIKRPKSPFTTPKSRPFEVYEKLNQGSGAIQFALTANPLHVPPRYWRRSRRAIKRIFGDVEFYFLP